MRGVGLSIRCAGPAICDNRGYRQCAPVAQLDRAPAF